MNEVKIIYKRKIPYNRMVKVTQSQKAYDYIKAAFTGVDHYEEMYSIILNRSNMILGHHKISQGGIVGTVCDIRLVFQSAILANAVAIIIVHNHPSGNTEPSPEDIKLTEKLKKAGCILDITLLDHLIVASDGYTSLVDENYI